MTLLHVRRMMDVSGYSLFLSVGFILWPVAAAAIAARRNRSILIWATLTLFMPLAAPFAMIPFCSWGRTLCGGYGVFGDLIRLAAGPICPVYLWVRPALAAPQPGRAGRSISS